MIIDVDKIDSDETLENNPKSAETDDVAAEALEKSCDADNELEKPAEVEMT